MLIVTYFFTICKLASLEQIINGDGTLFRTFEFDCGTECGKGGQVHTHTHTHSMSGPKSQSITCEQIIQIGFGIM